MYIGPSLARVTKGDTFTFKFTMTVADVPTTLTTPTVKAYEEGSNVEFTGGITLNVDYDGKTGLNELIIDTSDAAYTAGKNYDFFFSAGSIGAVTLVGTAFFHLALIPEPADLRAVNGGSTGATAGKLELEHLIVSANDGTAAVHIENEGSGEGLKILNSMDPGNTSAVYIESYSKNGIEVWGDGHAGISVNGYGEHTVAIELQGFKTYGGYDGGFVVLGDFNYGVAIEGAGGGAQPDRNDALLLMAGSGDSDAIHAIANDAGKAINALGQVLIAPTNTDDSALVLTPNGDGLSIDAVVEGSVGIIQSLMLANAANAGKTNGMGTATAHLRNLEDTKNRVTASLDASGNRTSITLDVT